MPALKDPFAGRVDPLVYSVVRMAAAILVLVRTTSVLAPILDLDHHGWVSGIENAPWSDPVIEPRLRAPLVPGLDLLGDPTLAAGLVVLRTALAAWLLTGLAPRTTAGALAVIGWCVMASDRFRYLHHLHLLWVLVALVALTPSGERLSLRRGPTEPWAPRWPLQLLRLQALVIYAASGVAKLRAEWLDGTTLDQLAGMGLVDRTLVSRVGPAPLAVATVVIELALVPLLAWRRTRLAAVVVALAFHAGTGAAMLVSTFPWTMAVLLVAFLPWREEWSAHAEPARERGRERERERERGRERERERGLRPRRPSRPSPSRGSGPAATRSAERS